MVRSAGRICAALTASLSVLVLLIGLIAMHHLAGGRHDATHAVAPDMAMAPAAGHTPAAADTVNRSAHTGAMDDGLTFARSLPPAEAAVAVACLAVLFGAGVVFTLRRVGSWPAGRLVLAPSPSALRGPPGRGPPRSLLAELCVLRI